VSGWDSSQYPGLMSVNQIQQTTREASGYQWLCCSMLAGWADLHAE